MTLTKIFFSAGEPGSMLTLAVTVDEASDAIIDATARRDLAAQRDTFVFGGDWPGKRGSRMSVDIGDTEVFDRLNGMGVLYGAEVRDNVSAE